MKQAESRTPGSTGSHLLAVLRKAYRCLLAQADESYRQIGLCDSDFRVLDTLLRQGPLPVNTVGDAVELTTGSITTAIDRLEAKRLVVRKHHTTDKRIRVVELTAKGRRLIEKGRVQHAKDLDRAVNNFSPTERELLVSLLSRMVASDK